MTAGLRYSTDLTNLCEFRRQRLRLATLALSGGRRQILVQAFGPIRPSVGYCFIAITPSNHLASRVQLIGAFDTNLSSHRHTNPSLYLISIILTFFDSRTQDGLRHHSDIIRTSTVCPVMAYPFRWPRTFTPSFMLATRTTCSCLTNTLIIDLYFVSTLSGSHYSFTVLNLS